MTKNCLIYITAPDHSCAEKISQKLLEERLIACANIFPAVQSFYWWQGKILSDQEVVIILKTQMLHFEIIEKIVSEIHPSQTPCLVALKLDKGADPFMSWIVKETSL